MRKKKKKEKYKVNDWEWLTSELKMSPPHQNGNHLESSSAESVIDNNECGTKKQPDWEGPAAQGLYDPANEHEACGVGFIVAIDGKRSHKVHYLNLNP